MCFKDFVVFFRVLLVYLGFCEGFFGFSCVFVVFRFCKGELALISKK